MVKLKPESSLKGSERRFASSAVLIFLLSALFLTPVTAFAQEQEEDARVVAREREISELASREAQRAKERRVIEDLGEIDFSNILADPDNVMLNFNYAKQQVKQGNLLGAAGTLERILMVNPNLHQIRLFYAVVLFRLDNAIEAERELTTLEKADITDAMRKDVQFYLMQLRQRKKSTRFYVRQSVGFQYDSNRNAAPSSERRLARDISVDLGGKSLRQDDTSFLNITSLGFEHDIAHNSKYQLLGSFTYFMQEQTEVDSLDLQSFQYDVGSKVNLKYFDLTGKFYASHLFLSRENFMRSQGGSFTIDRKILKDKVSLFANSRIERQDFLPTTESGTARERDGNYVDIFSGASYNLNSRMRVSGEIGYAHKNATREFNTYDRLSLRASHTTLLGKGQFLVNSVQFNHDYYKDPDTRIASRVRRDQQFRYRAIYGVPLDTVLKIVKLDKYVPNVLKGVSMTASYEYFRSFSTITNYTYKNSKFQGMISKRWEF